jgi:hypothetical protein
VAGAISAVALPTLKPLMRIRTSPVAQANHLPDRLGATLIHGGLSAATAFADVTEKRVPEHAPFYVYGIYQLA